MKLSSILQILPSHDRLRSLVSIKVVFDVASYRKKASSDDSGIICALKATRASRELPCQILSCNKLGRTLFQYASDCPVCITLIELGALICTLGEGNTPFPQVLSKHRGREGDIEEWRLTVLSYPVEFSSFGQYSAVQTAILGTTSILKRQVYLNLHLYHLHTSGIFCLQLHVVYCCY